jgi:hypothetical protein
MRFIVLIILTISCICKAQTIDPAISCYYNSFLKECEKHKVRPEASKLIAIKFPNQAEWNQLKFDKVAPNGRWGGVAVIDSLNDIIVFFHPTFWYSSDSTGREMIAFHEFFHACFRLQHISNNLLMKRCAASNEDARYYRIHKDAILNEVFDFLKKR